MLRARCAAHAAAPQPTPCLFCFPAACPQAFLGLWGAPTTYSGKLGQPLVDVSLAGPEVGLVALVQVGAARG